MEPWFRYIEVINLGIKMWEVNPKECTEKGYYEWIMSKDDIRAKIMAWLDQLENSENQSLKDVEKAKYFREQGNTFFKKKDYAKSVESYTESARYATFDNNDFSMAIANRSASFFYTRRYEASLRDIELASSHGYPEKTLWKLYLRAAECHLGLENPKMAEKELKKLYELIEKNKELEESMQNAILKRAKDLATKVSKSPESKEKSSGRSRKKAILNPEDVLPKNIKFPFASASLVLKRSASMGRCVYAEKSVKKGDVLFLEKPFAWVPVSDRNDTSVCAHCFGCMDDSLIPCRGCLIARYCSPTCWKDAWAYHQWECCGYRMGLWQQIGISHLALKIMLVSTTSSDLTWFNDVQKLVLHIDKMSKRNILGLCIASLMVTCYIERFTDFFQHVDIKKSLVEKFDDESLNFNVDLSTIEGKKLYVGSMILRHSLQMLANAWVVGTIGLDTGPDKSTLISEEREGIAVGVYPSASMVNHSCAPTAILSFWRNWLVLKAVKDIPEGQEIFTSYGPRYTQMSKSKRKDELFHTYSFDCRCEACRNPNLDSYADRFEGFKCRKCSGSTRRLPNTNNWQCYDCSERGSLVFSFDEDLEEAAELYEKGIQAANMEKDKEAILYLKKCLAIRKKYMYKYNVDIRLTLQALGQCCALAGDCPASMSYFEQSLAIVEKRYGSDSLEVAIELNAITDICLEYLRETARRETEEYKNILAKFRNDVDRALSIITVFAGPWSDFYQKMNDKKEQLSGIFRMVRI